MSIQSHTLSLVVALSLAASLAGAASLDYTPYWAHLTDTEITPYNVEFGGFVDVVVKGNLAYALIEGGVLKVIDCADPSSVVERGSLNLSHPIRCAIRDHYLYVLSDWARTWVIDVDDPEDPVIIDPVSPAPEARDLLVVGSWLYIARADDTLAIYSLASSSTPALVGTVNLPAGHGERLAFTGERLVAAGDDGLVILDISVPDWPAIMGSIALGGDDTLDLDVRGDLALVGQGAQSLFVDIADPAAMVETAMLPVQGDGVCLTSNGQAWLGHLGCWMQSGLRIYDASDPWSPQYLHDEVIGLRGTPRSMVEYQGNVFVAEWVNWCAGEFAGFHVFHAGDYPPPAPLASAGLGHGYAMVSSGARVDVATAAGLRSWDLATPDEPQLVQILNEDLTFYLLDADRDRIVATTFVYPSVDNQTFRVVTRDAYGALTSRGDLPLPARPNGVAISGTRAAVGLQDAQGLYVIDVANPDAPGILADLYAGETVLAVALHDEIAVVEAFERFEVLDLSDPQNPVVLATHSHGFGSRRKYTRMDIVERLGRLWLVAAQNWAAQYEGGTADIFEITDPTVPRLAVSQRQLALDELGQPIWRDDLLVVPGSYHLTFYRCLDPDGPVEFLGRVPMFDGWSYGNRRSAAITPDALVTVSNDDVLQVWPLPAGVLTAVPGDEVPSPSALHATAVPNPFNPICEFRVTVPVAGELAVDVFDARGRRVRTFAATDVDAGLRTVRWDGRDRAGRPAPAGVYLARVRVGGHETSLKLTLAK